VVRPRSLGDISKATLRTYSLKSPINISGWSIKSNKGDLLEIPQAVNDYDPFGSTEPSDIILNSGDYLNLYSSKSPTAKNLRLNKCTGYLNNIFTFDPTFPKSCFRIDRDEITSFTGACQSYILALRTCEEPSSTDINKFQDPLDAGCRELLRGLNYRGCYDHYYLDTNFLSKELRVWLDKDFSLDPQHDRLLLFDKEGLLVDEYTY